MSLFSFTPITERLTRINAPANVCAFLAVGNDKAALIDTGFGYGDLKSYVESLTDKPVTVVLTHGHYDHVGGAGAYEKAFIPKEDITLALEHSKKEVRKAGLAGFAITASDDELPPELEEGQLIGISDGWTLNLGGYTVRMLAMHGHTPGMMCPLFVEDRIILFGDALNSAAFMQFDHSLSVEEYRDNLLIFKAKYGDLYDRPIYSHPHNFGNKDILDEMAALCKEIMKPGYQGLEMPEVLGSGNALAKPVDAVYRRLDGGSANIAYNRENLYKPVRKLSPFLAQIKEMSRQGKEQMKAAPVNDAAMAAMIPEMRKNNDAMIAAAIPIPECITLKEEKLGTHEGEFYIYDENDPEKKKDKFIFYIHGGGFENGTFKSRRYTSLNLCKLAKCDGFSVEYTQWPEGKHPQGLNDCYDAYHEVLKLGYKPENIIVSGESGGATLTLALSLKLKENGESLPGALITFCPLTDAGDDFTSRTERDTIDPMVTGTVGHDIQKHYFDGADPKDPYVSVRYGNYEGFPKTYICVGTDEVLYDDSVDLHQQMDRLGVENRLSIYQDLYHAFAMLPSPEADEALKEAVSYIFGE